jgi:hypothetical protein
MQANVAWHGRVVRLGSPASHGRGDKGVRHPPPSHLAQPFSLPITFVPEQHDGHDDAEGATTHTTTRLALLTPACRRRDRELRAGLLLNAASAISHRWCLVAKS